MQPSPKAIDNIYYQKEQLDSREKQPPMGGWDHRTKQNADIVSAFQRASPEHRQNNSGFELVPRRLELGAGSNLSRSPKKDSYQLLLQHA